MVDTPDTRQSGWLQVFRQVATMTQAFDEQQMCVRAVYERAAQIVRTGADIPDGYSVGMGPLPAEQLSFSRNLFSILFIGVYHAIGIGRERRLLYGELNHLFRTWVTSGDNLLDGEDKVVLPISMPGNSRVMREVVGIMAADRVLFSLLNDAESAGVISAVARDRLSRGTLQVLLPSAAQEATEEKGVTERPTPADVLARVHRYKTGLLFHVPLLGPEVLEEVSPAQLQELKNAMLDFGIGCQLLDDIRDMATDYCEGRHNYLLSQMWWADRRAYEELAQQQQVAPGARLYRQVPDLANATARRGFELMRDGLIRLGRQGLGIGAGTATTVATRMFDLLDLGELRHGIAETVR